MSAGLSFGFVGRQIGQCEQPITCLLFVLVPEFIFRYTACVLYMSYVNCIAY